MRSGLFLMKFEALGFVVKHDFAYLVNLLNRNPNQGENGEIKSLLITISETQPWSYFPLFKRDELVMSLRTSIKTYGHKFVHLLQQFYRICTLLVIISFLMHIEN